MADTPATYVDSLLAMLKDESGHARSTVVVTIPSIMTDQQARILADAQTAVPREETARLRMIMQFMAPAWYILLVATLVAFLWEKPDTGKILAVLFVLVGGIMVAGQIPEALKKIIDGIWGKSVTNS